MIISEGMLLRSKLTHRMPSYDNSYSVIVYNDDYALAISIHEVERITVTLCKLVILVNGHVCKLSIGKQFMHQYFEIISDA